MVTSRATFNHDYNSGPPNKRMRQTLLSFAKKAETLALQNTNTNSVLTESNTHSLFLKCMRLDQQNKYDCIVVALSSNPAFLSHQLPCGS